MYKKYILFLLSLFLIINFSVFVFASALEITTIESLLTDKTTTEKAKIKSQEIAKLDLKGKYIKDNFDIEIIGDIKAIEVNGSNGIELFAKAFKNGKQLGFGKDGSVEIERFKIYNPPILIDNPLGTITRTWEEKDLETDKIIIKTRTLEENPKKAIENTLLHTIKIVGKEDTNIIKGKIGNTTSTFYTTAGANSPVDGYTFSDPGSLVSWNTLRNSLEADDRTQAHDDAVNTTNAGCIRLRSGSSGGSGWKNLSRAIFLFDTSTLPDEDLIDSATLSIYNGTRNSNGTFSVEYGITDSNPASDSAIIKADYADTVYNDVDFATRVSWDNVIDNAYHDYSLNSSGLSNIDNTGLSKFAQRIGADIDDTEPAGITGDAYRGFDVYFADETGTASDPKLVIEHSAEEEEEEEESGTVASSTTDQISKNLFSATFLFLSVCVIMVVLLRI